MEVNDQAPEQPVLKCDILFAEGLGMEISGQAPEQPRSSWQHWCGPGSRHSCSAAGPAVGCAIACATAHPSWNSTCIKTMIPMKCHFQYHKF